MKILKKLLIIIALVMLALFVFFSLLLVFETSEKKAERKDELQTIEIGFMKLDQREQKKRNRSFQAETKRIETEIQEFTNLIQQCEIEDDQLFPSFKRFSNTIKTLSETYFDLEYEAMLDIAEIMVSNIFVHKGKVVEVGFKPPFDTLFSNEKSDGWGGGITLFQL